MMMQHGVVLAFTNMTARFAGAGAAFWMLMSQAIDAVLVLKGCPFSLDSIHGNKLKTLSKRMVLMHTNPALKMD